MTRELRMSRSMTPDRGAEQAFLIVSGLLFAASAAVTIAGSASMSAMSGMPMPGGWTMSMTWMRMPGQTWLSAAAVFLGMWVAMMAAMMLPSLIPILRRYRRTVTGAAEARLGVLTAVLGAGYFFIWTVFGLAVFALGVTFATLAMQLPALSRTVPIATGVVVLTAGAFQFSAWKTHHLACCRDLPGESRAVAADARAAWRRGLDLGLHCCYSSVGLTAILLVVGVMDLRTMAAVTAAITAERLAPSGEAIARRVGSIVIGAGVLLIARAATLG